jgi:phospholipid-binding lipoprotein MlaA
MNPLRHLRLSRTALTATLFAFATLLSACATPGKTTTGGDPYEGVNRKIFAFNDALDNNVIRPVATGYKNVVPRPVRTCVSNVFGNISDVWSGVNSCLQGKGGECVDTFMRVSVNTVFGLAGCIDIASSLPGLDRHSEDFGQTLAVWGVSSGPFVMLPLYGPSTIRDTAGTIVGAYADPMRLIHDDEWYWGLTALRIVSLRADLLDASRLLDGAALDRYSFVRDAYIQRRNSQIYDGNPPDSQDAQDSEPYK